METQASRFPVRKMQKSVCISICTENDCCVPPPGPLPGSPWGLEDPDSRQKWNYGDGGGAGGEAAQPGEGTVAMEGPQGPPAQNPPLLSSAGLVSAHLSQK